MDKYNRVDTHNNCKKCVEKVINYYEKNSIRKILTEYRDFLIEKHNELESFDGKEIANDKSIVFIHNHILAIQDVLRTYNELSNFSTELYKM